MLILYSLFKFDACYLLNSFKRLGNIIKKFRSLVASKFLSQVILKNLKIKMERCQRRNIISKESIGSESTFLKKVAETRCTGGFWNEKSRGKKIFIQFENFTPTGPPSKIGGFWPFFDRTTSGRNHVLPTGCSTELRRLKIQSNIF